MSALAIRAMRCKGWRWMPGMLADGIRVIRVVDGHPVGVGSVIETGELFEVPLLHVRPCLDDPATLGGLLDLVREAWDDPRITTRFIGYRGHETPDAWRVVVRECMWDETRFWSPPTSSNGANAPAIEAAALVAALEGAP